MSPYWQAQLEPMNHGFQNLSSALLQLPRLRAQAGLYAARQAEQQQAAQEAAARTQLLATQNAGLLAGQLDDRNLAGALKRYAADPQDTDAQGDVISGFGQAYKKDPQGTAKALGDLFAQFAARNGSTNYPNLAALQGQAAAIANNQADNAEKAARPLVVGNGATLMTPAGQPLASGGYTLNPGQQRDAPAGLTAAMMPAAPSAADVDDPAAAPAAATAWQSPVAANPAVVSSRGGAQPGATGTAGAGNASSAGPQMVRVRHPNGQTGVMPAANVPAATRMGYQVLEPQP